MTKTIVPLTLAAPSTVANTNISLAMIATDVRTILVKSKAVVNILQFLAMMEITVPMILV